MSNEHYNIVSIIRKKRDQQALSASEITFLIDEYTAGRVPDYQMSAFLMAAFLNELSHDEAAALTEAMLHSGTVLDLGDIPGKKVDKHSTGGVGDKLSLILAPIVASCGVPVPMISGRGLGHTGGTLDKMEAIPGFNVNVSLDHYRSLLREHTMVMAGQTREIAPADKKLYALRDVTATVESIPLIAGSIMSKKLAEGIDALVLDVKFGAGAFMKDAGQARELAQTLVSIGEAFGKETVAYLTNMEQPLGYKVGNWLEVEEAMAALQGEGPEDVMEVTHWLAGTMIYLGDAAASVEEGIEKSKAAIANGQALDTWLSVTEAQGGDSAFLKDLSRYEQATYSEDVCAVADGYIHEMDAYKVGMASLELGAGRRTKEDTVDHAAGIILTKKKGDAVKKGETIATLRTNNESRLPTARAHMQDAVCIGSTQPDPSPMVVERIDKKGTHSI